MSRAVEVVEVNSFSAILDNLDRPRPPSTILDRSPCYILSMPVSSPRIIRLPRPVPSRYGVPVIRAVDRDIFRRTYFTHCLSCTFCGDACCDHGVDVDMYHVRRWEAHAAEIEEFTGVPRDRWFEPGVEEDPEVPGGASRRTRVEDGRCVFRARGARGCRIHAFCLERGLDYHELKSLVDCLFPITFCDGLLCPSDDVEDETLVCQGTGPTLYRGLRHELAYYFGGAFVDVLDRLDDVRRRRDRPARGRA